MIKEVQTIALMRLCVADPQNAVAWSEFLRRITPKIKCFIRGMLQIMLRKAIISSSRILPGAFQEEDLLNKVLIRMVRNDFQCLRRFSGSNENELFAYLAGVARNVVLSVLRRHKAAKRDLNHRTVASLSLQLSTQGYLSDPTGCRSLERRVLAAELWRMAEKLLRNSIGATAERDRQIFYLYFCEDISIAKIAQISGPGLTTSGVKKVIRRIVRHLRELARANASCRNGRPLPSLQA